SGLAHAADHDATLAGEKQIDGCFERGVQSRKHVQDRLRFNLEDAARGGKRHAAPQRRTICESSLSRASRAGSSARGRALAPSERAAEGLSCVSRKIPSTPVATPARASGSMNSGWPPLAWPWPPGS